MPSNNNSLLRLTAWLSALFLVILGAKFWIIQAYGTGIPYWDQWIEADFLFKPWLEGHLAWGTLFAPHNEHRIFFTRSLDLVVLGLNGQLDPLLQMVVNAFIHAGYACGLVYCLWIFSGRKNENRIVFLLAPFFAFPFAAENTIHGFQSQMYFLGIFAVLTIVGLGFGSPGSRWWFAGLAMAVMSIFTMASGLLASLAVMGLVGLRALKQRGLTQKQLLTLGGSLAVFILGLVLNVNFAPHQRYHARSILMFCGRLMDNLAWPYSDQPVMVVIVCLPLIITAIQYFRADCKNPRAAEFVLTLGLWGCLQAIALAYGRWTETSGRYLDTLSTIPIASVASLFILGEMTFHRWSRGRMTMVAILWLGVLFWGLGKISWTTMASYQTEANYLQWNRLASLMQEENIRAFVATDDPGYLLDKPLFAVPSATPDRLINSLRDSTLQAIMPPACRVPLRLEKDGTSDTTFVLDGYPPDKPKQDFTRVWGNYQTNGTVTTGSFVSQPLSATLPKLIVPVCCGPDLNGIRLQLVELQTGRRIEVNPDTTGRWHTIIATAPKNPFRMEVSVQNHDSWVSVGEINEMGRLSFYALWLLNHAVALLLAGLGLGVLLAGGIVVCRGTNPGDGGFADLLILLIGLGLLAYAWTGRNFDVAGLTSKLYQDWAVDFSRRRDLPGVERYLRKALWQQPADPQTLVALANVILCDRSLETNQAREQAALYYQAALRLKPDYAEARQRLEETLLEPGRTNAPAD